MTPYRRDYILRCLTDAVRALDHLDGLGYDRQIVQDAYDQRWRTLDEERPAPGTRILVVDRAGFVEVAVFDVRGWDARWYFDGGGVDHDVASVTHWRPLPPAPGGAK